MKKAMLPFPVTKPPSGDMDFERLGVKGGLECRF